MRSQISTKRKPQSHFSAGALHNPARGLESQMAIHQFPIATHQVPPTRERVALGNTDR
jgi:hypothetical protein